MKTLDRLIDEQFERAAEPTGLSPGEWRVLNRLALGAEQTATVEESLAPLTDRDRTVEDTLASLEKAGLVEQRAQEHRLTDEGFARANEVEGAAMEQVREGVCRELQPEEYDGLLAVLERAAKGMGWQPM